MDKLREEILSLSREGKKLAAIKLYCTAKDIIIFCIDDFSFFGIFHRKLPNC